MIAIIAAAAVLRLASLDNRPMHCDEAVHADKFRLLLEHGDYTYNPYEYHGPSLNFLTLPVARLAGADKLTEVTEIQLRLVPAVFGIILVGLVLLLRDELGPAATISAAALAAFSPAMVFYSRYYIQEMLLVCFSFGAMVALWRLARSDHSGTVPIFAQAGGTAPIFAQRKWDCPLLRVLRAAKMGLSPSRPPGRAKRLFWLLVLGLCIGMMHASKETCVIALVAMAVAAAPACRRLRRAGLRRPALSGLIVLLIAAAVSAACFSSFLVNPHGVLDSYTTYFHYLGRSSGEGSAGRHVYPWYYYLRHLFWYRQGDGPLWTEAPIAALTLVALVAAAVGKGLRPGSLPFVRFLGIYTVVMILIYCALPYKTPWCALGFLQGMILLAGVGAAVLLRIARGYVPKAIVVVLLLAAAGHLAWQSHRASFAACEDPNNPYVYAHTTSDVISLVERVGEVATAHPDYPDAVSVPIQVICPDADYWPLPWYLRRFRQVGCLDRMPRGPAAPLIVTQPEMESALSEYLYRRQPPGQRHLYVPVPPKDNGRDWLLRPHVPLRIYARLDLWNAYQAGQDN